MKLCRKCGSKKIQIFDFGYSSFNIGGAKCQNCGHTVSEDCGCLPSKKELWSIWNGEERKAKKRIEELQEQINEIKIEFNWDT